MELFYKISPKQLLDTRKEILIKSGIPSLKKNGFEESPYKGMRYGKLDSRTYVFDLCRINASSELEAVTVYISMGDRWIKIFLNIFKLNPNVSSLNQLKGLDGMQFFLPPNNFTKMRLRINGLRSIPLFNPLEHKIKSFYCKSGLQKRIVELSEVIRCDLNNIDSFIARWHELYEPLTTDWEGNKISNNFIVEPKRKK